MPGYGGLGEIHPAEGLPEFSVLEQLAAMVGGNVQGLLGLSTIRTLALDHAQNKLQVVLAQSNNEP